MIKAIEVKAIEVKAIEVKAIEVKAIKEFQLYVKFNDGVEGLVDLSYLKNGEAFKYWRQSGNFEKAYIDGNGIAWNENLDIDVLNVYLKITRQSFEEFMNKHQPFKKIEPLQ